MEICVTNHASEKIVTAVWKQRQQYSWVTTRTLRDIQRSFHVYVPTAEQLPSATSASTMKPSMATVDDATVTRTCAMVHGAPFLQLLFRCSSSHPRWLHFGTFSSSAPSDTYLCVTWVYMSIHRHVVCRLWNFYTQTCKYMKIYTLLRNRTSVYMHLRICNASMILSCDSSLGSFIKTSANYDLL